MNENVKTWFNKNFFWFIFCGVFLIWAIGGTVAGIHFYDKYTELDATVVAADAGEFIKQLEHHENTITTLRSDLGAALEYGRAADERAGYAEGIIERAHGFVQLSNADFIELRITAAGMGSTISEAIRTQQRINDIVVRIERNNQRATAELKSYDRESTGR